MLRFGTFELDDRAGELRRNGALVRLPPQPFQVLRLLARHSGEVVDRDTLRREVWGETTVDFDRSLNVCIAQIRTALNDDADAPRFIQTLPRRGYRFVAPVQGADRPAPPRRRRWPIAAAVAAIAAGLAAAGGYRIVRPGDSAIRLAVLPFEGPESAQVDGFFDELLTRLGGIQTDRLRVIGRRSATAFRGAHLPLREIGRRLNVAYIVEATARTDAGGLRLAARLVHTADDAVLWSATFTQDSDPARFEEDTVALISAAVLERLFPGAAPAAAPEACREGWEAYRTGRLLAASGTLAGLEKSIPRFEEAGCPAARLALADTWIRLARAGRSEGWDRARAALTPAADLARGNIAFWRDWDWKTAEASYQAALRRRPGDPDAHHDYAWLLVARGRRAEGLASLQRAIALDPLSARVNIDAGWLYLQAGRFHEAAAQARRALELDPSMNEARACLSRALVYAGEPRAALEVLREESPGRIRSVDGLPPAEAIRTLWRSATPSDPYQRAWRMTWVGERDQALAALESALEARSSMMPMVASDPAFAGLRDEPRFRAIVKRMGL
jgi:DNA-binding winged helix-turn-helix (wHTH) protein/TolB-like protein/thioredoxin-like negative regulator of GroEL